jgi:hypothetical protein
MMDLTKGWRITAVASLLLAACGSAPTTTDLAKWDEMHAFIAEMAQRHGFDRAQL